MSFMIVGVKYLVIGIVWVNVWFEFVMLFDYGFEIWWVIFLMNVIELFNV